MRLRPITNRHRGPHIIRNNRETNHHLEFYIWAEGLTTSMCFHINTIWWLNVFLCQPGKTFSSVAVLVERRTVWYCNSKCFLSSSDCVSACMTNRLRTFVNRFRTCCNHFFYIAAKSKLWAAGSNLFWDQPTSVDSHLIISADKKFLYLIAGFCLRPVLVLLF